MNSMADQYARRFDREQLGHAQRLELIWLIGNNEVARNMRAFEKRPFTFLQDWDLVDLNFKTVRCPFFHGPSFRREVVVKDLTKLARSHRDDKQTL